MQSLNEGLERVIQSILTYGNGIYDIYLIVSAAVMVVPYYVAVFCYTNKK